MKVKGTVSTATSMGMFLVFCMKNWCSSIITLFYFHIRWFLICWKVFKCFVQVEYWRRCLVAIYIYTHTILSFSVFTPSFFFIFSLLTLDSLPAVCVISFFFFFLSLFHQTWSSRWFGICHMRPSSSNQFVSSKVSLEVSVYLCSPTLLL